GCPVPATVVMTGPGPAASAVESSNAGTTNLIGAPFGSSYAVSTRASCSNPSSRTASSRILNFCTFPVTVSGKASTTFQCRGTLYDAIRPTQYLASSSGVGAAPARGLTQAITSSPYLRL